MPTLIDWYWIVFALSRNVEIPFLGIGERELRFLDRENVQQALRGWDEIFRKTIPGEVGPKWEDKAHQNLVRGCAIKLHPPKMREGNSELRVIVHVPLVILVICIAEDYNLEHWIG